MANDLHSDFDVAYADLIAANQLLNSGLTAHKRALNALEIAHNALVKGGTARLPSCEAPVTKHRRLHRSGRPPKIDTDPELQTFIEARIDRLTFVDIAKDIAATFSPERSVGKSAIHAWWKRKNNKG